MIYLKRYNESVEDIDHAVVKIKENFTKEKYNEILDKEKKEWSDEYTDTNSNGEAEEIIVHQMISWYKKEYKKPDIDESKLESAIKIAYNIK